MAAERDEAGSPGPGLSGTGRDHAGLEAGTTRSMAMGDAPGSADVHAGIAFNANVGADEGGGERATSRVKDMAGGVADAASGLGHRARSAAGDVADRAGDLASRARDRMGELAERAQGALEERGWLERMRENPLPALGVAFAAGFLLAGGGSGREVEMGGTGTTGGSRGLRGNASRMRGELRGALAAGLSAGLAQGARAFLRNIGAEDGVINSVMQNLPGLGGGGTSRGPRSGGGRMGSTGGTGSSGGGRPGGMGSTGGGRSGGYSGGTGSYSRAGATTGTRTGASQGGMQGGTAQRHREPSHRENL